jgi:hypothetical protein
VRARVCSRPSRACCSAAPRVVGAANGATLSTQAGIDLETDGGLARIDDMQFGVDALIEFLPWSGIPDIATPDVSKGQALLPNNIDMGPRSPWGGMLHRGYIMSWNGTLERQLPFSMVGSVGYVATRTIHQLIDRNINTGGKNYDVKIAKALFLRALDSLLARVKSYTFDEVVFVVGNDLLNSDDLESRTTKGTTVTTDGRYQKTFATVREVMTQSIERLRLVAPKVKVVMVSGNHDKLSVWHLGDSLECWFHKYTDVEIDNSPRHRKYHRFGKVMLLFTHGDKGSRKDYPLLMASEQPEMFGETVFREAHTGHYHQTKVEENHGIRARRLEAIARHGLFRTRRLRVSAISP